MQAARHSRVLALAAVGLAALGIGSAAGAPAGGPQLRAAKAVDSDRDGSVDTFELTFSGTVKGKADSSAPFRFGVAGYRVTGAGAPRGRKVRLKVAEARVCDIGNRPRVSYRPGSGGLQSTGRRPLRASKVVVGKSERGAPRLLCAATADSDGDGHVDAVVLGYDKKVRNRAQSSGRMPFEVDRYSVASVGKARGPNIALRLREKDAFDTDAVPAVIYKTPKAKRERRFAVAGSGGRARNATFNRTRDRSLPRAVALDTVDANENGQVDGVRAQFTEPVRAGRGGIDVRGATVTGLPAGERRTVTADVAEPGLTGGARPEVTLGAGGSLVDAAGNVLPSTTRAAADGAPPVIVSALTSDRGGAAGRLDTVTVDFSEPIGHPPDSDGSYPLSVPGYRVTSAGGASGSSLSLSLAEAPGPDGGVRPAVAYARGAATAVRDASDNEAAGRSFSGSRDGVAPVLVGAALLDQDLDGMVDAVRYDFSESVSHSPSDCRAVCSFSLAGYQLELAGPGVGASVTVAVTEQAGGATVSTAGYSPLGGGVRDGSGNTAPAASLPTADASPPVATSAVTVDSDNDGRIDRIDMTFSEPIAAAADSQAPFSFDAAGYAVAGVSAASDDSLSVSLTEVASFDTGSAPQLTYTGQGNRLTDANGTEHARRGYPGLTRDAVAPRYLEARTADLAPANGNGRVDAVDLVYSEEMAGSNEPARFTVSGPRSVTSVEYLGDRVRVNFAEGTGYDTDARPTASYDGSGDVRDLPEGSGDTAQSAPSAAGQALDAAGPVIVTAATGEESEPDPAQVDGKLDSVRLGFSEAIDASPNAPSAIALGDGLTVDGATAVSAGELLLRVREGAEPVGGLRPSVTVTAPAEIPDKAASPNAARGGAFGGATDGVRPALVSAQDGERTIAGDCARGVVDGVVDCFRARWSEGVNQPNSPSVFSGSSRTPLEVMSATPADSTDIRVTPASSPDRDTAGRIAYVGGGGVTDGSANPAIPGGPLGSEAACLDRGDEDNDVRADSVSMNALGFRVEQHLCAADRDWYLVDAMGAGEVHVRIDPFETLSITARLEDVGGSTVAGPVTSSVPGEPVTLYLDGLTPGDPYWVEVSAGGLQEGPYCADPTPSPGESCDDGDATPQ